MKKGNNPQEGLMLESKSRIGQLTREIDGLVRVYVNEGRDDAVARAIRLSRERERLLKPKAFRDQRVREAG
jgi:hypothetical protein